MGQLGFLIGELIMILGGLTYFLVYGGYYMPRFKNEDDKSKHLERIEKTNSISKVLALVLVAIGVIKIVMKFI